MLLSTEGNRQWCPSMMSADKIFEALSSAPRRRILAYLSRTDMTAGDIVRRFAGVMSQPAISKHLSVLENSGLVWREKRGQNVHYGLREDALTGALVRFLGEVCPRSRRFARESAAAKRRKTRQ
jgi:ArsR family transcriptional regulator, arsenate/arsenite/antimonite-responsive transcriptional repressor